MEGDLGQNLEMDRTLREIGRTSRYDPLTLRYDRFPLRYDPFPNFVPNPPPYRGTFCSDWHIIFARVIKFLFAKLLLTLLPLKLMSDVIFHSQIGLWSLSAMDLEDTLLVMKPSELLLPNKAT